MRHTPRRPHRDHAPDTKPPARGRPAPKKHAPKHDAPRSSAAHGDAKPRAPKHGAPSRRAARHGDAERGAPRSSSAKHGTSPHGEAKQRAPKHGASPHGEAKQRAPKHGAPPHRSARHGAAEHGAPRPSPAREPSEARPRRRSALAPKLEPLPGAGEWVWGCREGFEQDVVDELSRARASSAPRLLAPALLASRGDPPSRDGALAVTFARQGFAVHRTVRAGSPPELAARVTEALREAVLRAAPAARWALHVWVPDSTDGNRLSRSAETLARAVELRAPTLDAPWADRRVPTALDARRAQGFLAQVALVEPGTAIVGGGLATEALTLHPGGRARMRVSEQAPSRAAMKLEEALDWLGHGPERGESCVDLGAAPGGWTYVVMERGARVTAIDPGSMAPELMARKGLTHIRGSAFDFEPHGSVDWLLCDMVWRPLEVAALLAKWARRRWARAVVANIKLPMRGKAEFLERVRGILEEGGWKGVRFRQLYHDREEVTFTAYLPR